MELRSTKNGELKWKKIKEKLNLNEEKQNGLNIHGQKKKMVY